jgi:hypothetical protein
MGRRVVALLGDAAKNLSGFIDSDPSKLGTAWGKPVYLPEHLWSAGSDNRPYVLVTAMHNLEIRSRLEAEGFDPGRDYLRWPPLGDLP